MPQLSPSTKYESGYNQFISELGSSLQCLALVEQTDSFGSVSCFVDYSSVSSSTVSEQCYYYLLIILHICKNLVQDLVLKEKI